MKLRAVQVRSGAGARGLEVTPGAAQVLGNRPGWYSWWHRPGTKHEGFSGPVGDSNKEGQGQVVPPMALVPVEGDFARRRGSEVGLLGVLWGSQMTHFLHRPDSGRSDGFGHTVSFSPISSSGSGDNTHPHLAAWVAGEVIGQVQGSRSGSGSFSCSRALHLYP